MVFGDRYWRYLGRGGGGVDERGVELRGVRFAGVDGDCLAADGELECRALSQRGNDGLCCDRVAVC